MFKRLLVALLTMAALAAVPAWAQAPDAVPTDPVVQAPADIPDTLDMEQAVLMALERNPSMLAARYEALGAEDGRKSARGDFGPSVAVSYTYSRLDHKKPNRDAVVVTSDVDVYTATLNVHQDLFTGWRLLSTYEKAALNKDQAEAQVLNAELSLIGTVQENFLALLKARADVKSGTGSVARLQEQLKVTKAFYDVGLKPRLDLLQAQTNLASAKDTLLQAQNSVDTQVARLNTLLGLPLEAPVGYQGQLEYLPFSMDLDEALASAYENRPDLDIARKSVAIARKDKKITDSSFYPQIGADFDWSTQGGDPKAGGSIHSKTEYSDWTASLGATWTIFEWGKTYYASRQAQKTILQLEQSLANTRLEASFEVKSNHLKIHEASERINVRRQALEEARESYRMAVARYQAQVGTNADVLDAQSELTDAETNLSQAQADYQLAISSIFVSMGRQNPALTTN